VEKTSLKLYIPSPALKIQVGKNEERLTSSKIFGQTLVKGTHLIQQTSIEELTLAGGTN